MKLEQGELFPLEVLQVPTIAMQRGEDFVTQCSHCGLLVCASREPVPLGACPACGCSHWWEQELDVGPFKRKMHT